ncbi:MAG: cytochrome-c peroxidase [Gemmatimonadetes bacterium]|nr:cytochrome-c peroxidase [Gemmatimonadota bacterium]
MGGSDNLGPRSATTGSAARSTPDGAQLEHEPAQFWDGRAASLQEQAGGPIANPGEMALSHGLALDVLRSIPQYVVEFGRVFGNPDITIAQSPRRSRRSRPPR